MIEIGFRNVADNESRILIKSIEENTEKKFHSTISFFAFKKCALYVNSTEIKLLASLKMYTHITAKDVNSENRGDLDKMFFFSRFFIGFALDFTCVARHSDQCSKLSCGIPMLPASKAFTRVPICEDVKNSR